MHRQDDAMTIAVCGSSLGRSSTRSAGSLLVGIACAGSRQRVEFVIRVFVHVSQRDTPLLADALDFHSHLSLGDLDATDS